MNQTTDKWSLGGHEFTSRFILGSGKFSLDLVKACVENAGTEIVTLAIRRANEGGLANILDYIPENVTLLPNTSGARTAEEAVRIAKLSRELGCGDFVKVEVIHDSRYLLPDNYETIKATEMLAKEGFTVMPYMYPDLNAARDRSVSSAHGTHFPEIHSASAPVCPSAQYLSTIDYWHSSDLRLRVPASLTSG